jgi:hypothetical protein
VSGAALPPALRWLILTDNVIQALPAQLGQRPALQKLMLAGNQLRDLPPGLAQAHNLELVRLAANQLTNLPGWVTELPRLSWLALSGNPLGWRQAVPTSLASVPWQALRLGALLGEGASGHIYQVQPHHQGEAMALKLFKGAVTSDGLPEHELAACLAAGQHPALCTPSAELVDHPQGARGLLMPLIAPEFVNLAGPPSLATCTRDVYPAALRLPVAVMLRLVHTVAQAVAHLHQNGVMHGDLYAHNILWNPLNGQALLSDFGAATVLPADQPEVSRALQALEVRAFACLLEELLAHTQCTTGSGFDAPLARCREVMQACRATQPQTRPSMAEVLDHLGQCWHP